MSVCRHYTRLGSVRTASRIILDTDDKHGLTSSNGIVALIIFDF